MTLFVSPVFLYVADHGKIRLKAETMVILISGVGDDLFWDHHDISRRQDTGPGGENPLPSLRILW
jgi:hypothetical protein